LVNEGLMMQSNHNYLLVFDASILDAQLIEYFRNFNFEIIQKSKFIPSSHQSEIPEAILIHASLFQQDESIVKLLYQQYPVPIIIMSNQVDESLCVKVLESGADDFMVKPINPRELHARISAIKRRVVKSNHSKDIEKEVMIFANWRLYPSSRQLFNDNNQEIMLSTGEYDLLMAFVRQPQHILDREFLLQITKHVDLNPFDRRIDVQISRLRQKIEVDAKKPILIKTIRSAGYMFTGKVDVIKEEN